MDAVKIRNVILLAVGMYFAVNGLCSGSLASALIGLGLAAIALWVVFTGKVHRKFYKKHDPSYGAMTTSDDQELFDSIKRLKGRVERLISKDTGRI